MLYFHECFPPIQAFNKINSKKKEFKVPIGIKNLNGTLTCLSIVLIELLN